MITLFTIPRAFTGGDKIRQENALGSWTRLTPRPEIILFCDDPGVAKAAERFDCTHVPDVKRGKKGIPYVSYVFRLVSQLAANDVLCYANADIIFIQDFVTAVETVTQEIDQPFLIIGRRWDVAVPEPLKFMGNWQRQLQVQARQRGNRGSNSALDYFIYSRGAIVDLPDFLIGSPKWDNWLVKDAENRGLQVISATEAITCIHQRHDHVWPAEGIQHNQGLWWRSGGGVGRVYSGSWILGPGAKLRKKTGAKPKRESTRPGPSRPMPVIPKDELGLPLNLNVSAQELTGSAKKLRRQTGGVSTRGKHSHSGPSEKEILLAERAKLRQAHGELRAARIAARDARIAERKRERAG